MIHIYHWLLEFVSLVIFHRMYFVLCIKIVYIYILNRRITNKSTRTHVYQQTNFASFALIVPESASLQFKRSMNCVVVLRVFLIYPLIG